MQQFVKRAAIYARSAIPQELSGHFPLLEQVNQCSAYAQEHGYEVVSDQVYQEIGIGGSGQKLLLQSALTAAHNRVFDVLLVADYTRLARDGAVRHRLLCQFAAVGVTVESISEPDCGGSTMALLQSFARQLEQETLRSRTQVNRRTTKEQRKEQTNGANSIE